MEHGTEMITFEKAYEIVMDSAYFIGSERIDFRQSLNRILAESVVSDTDMPPFSKASVDGFACKKSDLVHDLEIIETIPAGRHPVKAIGHLQCSRIMTGAAVPEGADCVIMVEDTEIVDSSKVRFRSVFQKENIAYKGEDLKEGEIILKPGKLITPQDIAVMASVGHTSVLVGKKPYVGVISSGDELVEPWENTKLSQIRNSNSFQLLAQIARTAAEGRYYGIVKDDEEESFHVVSRAISENDVVIITGGVSMGDFDFIPSVLEKAGVKIIFSRVAVQPGKPTTFGKCGEKIVFGLPGNPVSSFVQFEITVRPLLYKMMGHKWKPLRIELPMKQAFKRKSADRKALIPVIITDDGFVDTVEFHGSGHISALPYADGIIEIPLGIFSIEKGELVSVRQI